MKTSRLFRQVAAGAALAAALAARAPADELALATGRTRGEVERTIETIGRTPPDWWDSVSLDYPSTLDLTGTYQSKKWEPRKKLGAYVFSVVTPNPRRWRPAIKLLHHVLAVRRDDPPRLAQGMNQLANAYCRYEKDYARGAFWYRKAAAGSRSPNAHDTVALAECYQRLGNPQMAAEQLSRHGLDRQAYAGAVKLWAEMGQTRRALSLADAMTRGRNVPYGHLCKGNVYRLMGKYAEAIACYEKTLELTRGRKKAQRIINRARGNLEAVRLQQATDLTNVRDGTYTATVTSFRGPLTVRVVVAGGRIASVKVTRHKDDIFFTSLTDIPRQIVARQALRRIDAVSGATVTSMAVVNATAKALAGGVGAAGRPGGELRAGRP